MSKEGKSVRQSGPVMANNNTTLETEKFTLFNLIQIYFTITMHFKIYTFYYIYHVYYAMHQI